jgi:Glycosyl hydrolases family 2, TIM barrel domain
MVWGEAPSAFEYSTTAARRMIAEWSSAVVRDISHPSLVTWVPLNESWGVTEIATSETMQQYSRALSHLTKTLDGSRPVISNDGWEQLDSDIWTIHDYEAGPILRERYGSAEAVRALFTAFGPARRRQRLSDEPDRGQPVMVTEFGGIRWEAGDAMPDSWGYSNAESVDDFRERLQSVLSAIQDSPVLAGFCYTQLTDTEQEANGLATADRVPKLPIEVLRELVLHGEDTLPYDFER